MTKGASLRQTSKAKKHPLAKAPFRQSRGWNACRKKRFGRCRPETACRRKFRKKPSGPRLLLSLRGVAQSTFSEHFPRHLVSGSRSPKHFLGHFKSYLGQGFGTSLDGRQDRNSGGICVASLPSDTKLLLAKNYSEISIFVKITNFTRNS